MARLTWDSVCGIGINIALYTSRTVSRDAKGIDILKTSPTFLVVTSQTI